MKCPKCGGRLVQDERAMIFDGKAYDCGPCHQRFAQDAGVFDLEDAPLREVDWNYGRQKTD